ncbi:MAG: glycosyltransferase [Prevotellaceae bacterium]|jgi:glycosyltransferase involved in cell wall biosynthesis|nr:glycosyltransferase [Prevotellaceae bacterium]
MKKILHIPKYYLPHTGGIEYVCYQIVTNLKDFAHAVVCFNDEKNTVIEEYEGIHIVRCGFWKKIKGFAISFCYYKHLKRAIKQFKPDIIHFHAPNPVAMLYLLWLIPKPTKLIVHYHAKIAIFEILYPFYKLFESMLFRRANTICVTSPLLLNNIRELAPYRGKSITIENIISTTDLDVSTEEDKARIEVLKEKYGNKKIVFTFGRHVYYKGFNYLIEADQYIDKNCEIIIGGTGPIAEKLKQMTSSKRIHFVGRISDNDLKYYLHAADVFAFPSINKAEAFGLALAQAMYCYTPAVTFTIIKSGVNYVNLDKITGLEVENQNVHKLAEAINQLLIDEKLRRELSSNAHQRVVENFTMECIKSKLISVYNSLLE